MSSDLQIASPSPEPIPSNGSSDSNNRFSSASSIDDVAVLQVANPEMKHQFVRLYKTFPGRNRFLCGGRMMVGPDWKILCYAYLLMSAPMIVFYVLVAPKVTEYISMSLPIIVGFLHLIVLVSLFVTATADPGIVPRAPPEPPVDPENPRPANPPWKEIEVSGRKIRVKYCQTCRVYRPPRATHCGTCNNCVLRFDHHCPWTGTCIGERNYRYFLIFVWSITFMCCFVVCVCIALLAVITANNESKYSGADMFWEAIAEVPAAVAVIVFGLFSMCCLSGLTCYHCGLTCKNMTTNEDFKHYGIEKERSPYDHGCKKNCQLVLCGSVSKSFFNWRALIPAPPDHQNPKVAQKAKRMEALRAQVAQGQAETNATGLQLFSPAPVAAVASVEFSKPDSSVSNPSVSNPSVSNPSISSFPTPSPPSLDMSSVVQNSTTNAKPPRARSQSVSMAGAASTTSSNSNSNHRHHSSSSSSSSSSEITPRNSGSFTSDSYSPSAASVSQVTAEVASTPTNGDTELRTPTGAAASSHRPRRLSWTSSTAKDDLARSQPLPLSAAPSNIYSSVPENSLAARTASAVSFSLTPQSCEPGAEGNVHPFAISQGSDSNLSEEERTSSHKYRSP
eukprot:ANDGO_04766.mRNA.1 Protein S-acyltransferase 8